MGFIVDVMEVGKLGRLKVLEGLAQWVRRSRLGDSRACAWVGGSTGEVSGR
jgi:hypothetical protein